MPLDLTGSMEVFGVDQATTEKIMALPGKA
jgi:hypothetical protein